MNQKRKRKTLSKILSILLAVTLVATSISTLGVISGENMKKVSAATLITSMDYYNSANGPTISHSGVDSASFGFVMPKFNGQDYKTISVKDVNSDLQLMVKQTTGTGGEWKNIQDVSYFKFNETWGWEYQQWSAAEGGWICWFKLTETTELKFHGKTNNVDLTYNMNFTKLPKKSLTSISTTEGAITADATGGSSTHWGQWTFNGDSTLIYDQVKDDITLLVDNNNGKGFVNLLSNASSGFLWDQNFGTYTDGSGGLWFKGVSWSFTLRLQKKSDPSIYQDAKITYTEPVRSNYQLTSYDGTTTFNAVNDAHNGSVAIVLPKVGNTSAIKSDLDKFKYQVCVGATYSGGAWSGGTWTDLADVGSTGWVYQGNGLNKNSNSQQWGYFVDTVYGLWFQPVKKNTYLRIGYPENGEAKGDVNNNYVYYTITGDPEATVNTATDMTDIVVDDSGTSTMYTPNGWSMIWNDEFSGASLDRTKWTPQEGYLIDENDISTYGWGNQELEYYADSPDNIAVSNGNLKITMKKQSKTFTQKNDPTKKATAQYSSGKLTTQNKFSVKYGRVDFRAKMPKGTGIWPAMWMLPNNNLYGAWANSGEIDVFEGRGRIPNMVFGTLHFGSTWPGNLNTSDVFNMVEDGKKKSDISDWHVYSVVWEEDNIKIYCDGKCYFKCTNADWYAGSDRGNPNAPFDQRFYLILNLAAGGTFDSFHAPDNTFTSTDMLVDYVRVYQRKVAANADEKPDKNSQFTTDGTNDNLFGDYKLATGTNPIEQPTTKPGEQTTTKPGEQPTINNNSKKLASAIKIGGISKKIAAGKSVKLSATVIPLSATNKTVTWKSSNKKYATVNANGKVTTKKAGKNKTVTITATAKDGSGTKATYKIKIMPKAVKKIKLNGKKSLKAGKTLKIKAKVTPSKKVNKKLIWITSNAKYATVNSKGIVKANKSSKGKVIKITAKATDGSGKKKTIKIKIK